MSYKYFYSSSCKGENTYEKKKDNYEIYYNGYGCFKYDILHTKQ